MLDPKTGKYTFIDTCFGTQHLNFALDANETLWTSGGAGDNPVGWLNTKMFLETGDAAKSQGWTSLIVDTNGNGERQLAKGDKLTDDGRQRLVHHGHLPKRDIMTGIGPVAVRCREGIWMPARKMRNRGLRPSRHPTPVRPLGRRARRPSARRCSLLSFATAPLCERRRAQTA